MATGTASTASSLQSEVPPESSQQTTEVQQEQQSLREALELREGVKRLCALVGVKSLSRNLKNEDDAVARNIEACEKKLLGITPGTEGAGGDDGMELMAARDIVVNYGPKDAAAQASPTPAEPAPAAPVAVTTPVATPPAAVSLPAITPEQVFSFAAAPGWLKALTLLGGFGGASIGGAYINQWINGSPAQPQVINQTSPYDIGGAVTPLELKKE